MVRSRKCVFSVNVYSWCRVSVFSQSKLVYCTEVLISRKGFCDNSCCGSSSWSGSSREVCCFSFTEMLIDIQRFLRKLLNILSHNAPWLWSSAVPSEALDPLRLGSAQVLQETSALPLGFDGEMLLRDQTVHLKEEHKEIRATTTATTTSAFNCSKLSVWYRPLKKHPIWSGRNMMLQILSLLFILFCLAALRLEAD